MGARVGDVSLERQSLLVLRRFVDRPARSFNCVRNLKCKKLDRFYRVLLPCCCSL